MRKLLIALFIVISLCSFVYADELVAPFTRVKQLVSEKGIEIEPGLKIIIFKLDGLTINFISAENGNVGIVKETSSETVLVAYNADQKIYFAVDGMAGKLYVINENSATNWGFAVFRILVERKLL